MGRDGSLFPTPHSPTALHQSGWQRPAERRQRRLRQAGTAAGDGGAAALGQGGRETRKRREGLIRTRGHRAGGDGETVGRGWRPGGGRPGAAWREGEDSEGEGRTQGERGVPQATYGGWKAGLRRLCGEFGPASALALTPPGSEESNCPRERRGDLGGLGVVERLTAGGDCKGERVENCASGN